MSRVESPITQILAADPNSSSGNPGRRNLAHRFSQSLLDQIGCPRYRRAPPQGAFVVSMIRKSILTLAVLAGFSVSSLADPKIPKYEEMDYGRFLTASWDNTKGENTLKGKGCTANKGIAIQLGQKEGAMLFDTDLCRWAGGWIGGYITYRGVIFDGAHGPNPSPAKTATLSFQTNPGPTWSKDGNFTDPRPLPKGPGAAKVPFGPLPKEQVKHKATYLHGDNVVVNYTVGSASLLEMPSLEKVNDVLVLGRTTNVLAAGAGAQNILWEGTGATIAPAEKNVILVKEGGQTTAIAGIALPPGAEFAVNDSRVILKFSNLPAGTSYKVTYAQGPADDQAKLIAAAKGAAKPADLRAFTKGGPARWTQEVKTKLTAGTPGEHDAYVVDTVEVPFTNPYKAWMRPGSFDFFKDGRIAIGTWSGDVWVVSGLNNDFTGEATWKRYATGIFQALGLRIVNDEVYVHGREGITRLRDLNNDGEADVYENFNNDIQTTPGFHEFAFDLQTDSKGNFYFGKGGPVNPGGSGFQPFSDHAGSILRVSADGSKLDVFATGVRAPNGISVGPNDEVTTGDNEGSWVPKCYVHLVKPNSFITVASLAHREQKPTDYGRHITFLPKDVDNSGGGQAWVAGNRWGLPAGTLLHLSYGTCSLYGVMHEDVGGTPQGGVYKFPLKFESGTMRARFSPADGQLYIVGLKGWQSSAAKDGCLHRVRYTGKPVQLPAALKVKPNGVEISFTNALDNSASDLGNYAVSVWNYKWSEGYGSGEFKPSDGQKGKDDLEVKAVQVSADRKKVFLQIDGLQPVMQMEIKLNVKGQNGAPVPNRILNTINVIPGAATAAN